MKKTGKKLLTLLLALVMVLGMLAVPVLAVDPFDYEGDGLGMIKADGSNFGMLTPQDGTTYVISNDTVVIHIVPKNTTVYNGLHFGSIDDAELTRDVVFNADGSFDFTVSKDNCGKAIPIAPVKPDGSTTSTQYYLAIPAASKLEDRTPSPEPVTLTDGTYQLPELAAGPSSMFNHFVADSTQLIVDGDTATVRFITDGSTASIQKYSRIALGKSSELVSTAYQPELAAGVTIIDGVLQPDDGTGKAKYLFEISLDKTAVEALLSNTIDEDIYITVWNNQGASSNDYVPGWYKASDDIYLSLGALGSKIDSGDEPDEPLTVTALVSISVAGEFVSATDSSVVAAVPVLVTDLDGSDDINIDETMVAAHKEFYNGGAAAGYASSVGQWGLGMDMLWGDTSYAFGYYVNNASAWSLSDPVRDGDHVQAFVYQDTQYYSDAYSYFDKLTAQTADSSVTLTLSSVAYDMNVGSMVASPYAGAAITVDGEATSYVTDSEGKVTVSFNESGTYLISAVGKDGEILVPPVCLVTVTLPEGEKDRLDLEITNNTSMFKAVTAYIETGDGVSELVMALSGTGYHELFKGTYEKAVANGDNTAAWIHGYENGDGKWEFRIPLAVGESYIPLVAISNSYYTKYLAGENDLERAFFARELVIDWDAGTLETGDYSGETITVSVSSSVDTLKAADSTQMTVVGGPNSNNFSVSFSLKVLDDTYDQVTYPTVVGSALGTQTAELSGGAFEIEMVNAPKRTAFEDGVPFAMTLRDAETGETVTVFVTIDILAKTIYIEPDYEAEDAGSTGSTTPAEDTAEAVTANVDVTAETEDGKATAALDAKAVTAALEEETEAEILSVKVESENADTVELTLDAEALKAVSEGGTALSVETEQGTLTLSKDELTKLAEDGGDVAVTLSANEDGSMTLDVTVDGETADVTVKAALPAVEDSQVLVLVKEDGTEEVIRKSLVEDGTAYAYLPAGCTVKAVDNSKEFEDVGDSWYTDYVDFVSSHGLFIGVSETEFAPQDNMTRAMLVTVLFRLEDEPEGFTGLKFGDVKGESWYTDAVAWASETGIVTGTDRGFEPNANISREQIATILYRYAKYVGLDSEAKGDVTKFSDGSEVSSWASDAMAWAVGVGLFEGDGTGSLNPKGDATRAEVAALMIRLVKLLVK